MRKLTLTTILAFIAAFSFAQAEWQYISPMPGSKYINPEQAIALRHGEILDQTSVRADVIKLTSKKDGNIQGNIKFSADGRTMIFTPEKPFDFGETIHVEVLGGVSTETGVMLDELSFSFTVKPMDNLKMLSKLYERIDQEEEAILDELEIKNSRKSKQLNDNNYPENYPIPTVTELDNPTPGYTYVSPNGFRGAPYGKYIVVLDKYGVPVYYRDWHTAARDFKIHSNNRIAYGENHRQSPENSKYLVLTEHYEIYDTLVMGNGYHVDVHDMLLLENNHYFLMAYDPQPVGMDTIVEGGDPDATVTGFVIQELDDEDNVIFQWRSWDHFEITDATHIDFTKSTIDYVHGNAFEVDNDGNLMFSSRHMNEITKIDLNSGDIIWRFGPNATNNMFTFTNDTVGFYYQHDIRRIENGNITLYDNGNHHDPSYSQSLEYEIDEENLTATLIWNYINDPIVYASATGSTQRLEGGNTLIDWGATWPICVTETTMDKEKVWEVEWPHNARHYRGVKYEWVTDIFEPNRDTIDFGTYDGYVPWAQIIQLTNNSDEDIEITSVHHYLESYQTVTQLPLSIPAGETVNFTFNLFPDDEEGQLDDVLTFNYDSFVLDTLAQRISRQVFVTAYVEDINVPEATINPADGASDVDRATEIKISFNESIAYPDGSVIKSLDLKDFLIFKENDASGANVEFFAYLDAWKRNITIRPNEELAPGMQYYVELPGGTVADHEGHVLEDAVMTTFTAIDDVVPTVEINPADSTTGAYLNQMIVFSFDEAVYNSDETEITEDDIQNIFSLKHNDEEGEDVDFLGVINDTKTTITLQPVENLDSYQYYYVEMLADMVSDMAGNVVSEMKYSHFETGEEVGIDEMNQVNISITPNPTKGNVDINIDQSGSKLIEVYNLTGSKIFEFMTNQNQTSLNLGMQKAGIYILKVTFDDHSTTTRKLVKD